MQMKSDYTTKWHHTDCMPKKIEKVKESKTATYVLVFNERRRHAKSIPYSNRVRTQTMLVW